MSFRHCFYFMWLNSVFLWILVNCEIFLEECAWGGNLCLWKQTDIKKSLHAIALPWRICFVVWMKYRMLLRTASARTSLAIEKEYSYTLFQDEHAPLATDGSQPPHWFFIQPNNKTNLPRKWTHQLNKTNHYFQHPLSWDFLKALRSTSACSHSRNILEGFKHTRKGTSFI